MMNSQLPERIAPAQPSPHSGNKNVISQIKRYNRGLADTGRVLLQPDLISFRNLLLESLAPAKVRVKLSGIRRSYKALVGNPQRRPGGSPAGRYASTEVIRQNPGHVDVKPTQDYNGVKGLSARAVAGPARRVESSGMLFVSCLTYPV